ncbi:MAG: nitroreductase family protein [Armatimonadetes bacterium]|nr:nitroreductase family protein [Armatimonadota bacterium]
MRKPAPADYPVLDVVRERWSPVAFDPVKPVGREKLLACFEAARWAASSQNEQPWAFIAGDSTDAPETRDRVFELLYDGNKIWANTAPVLILSVMKRNFDKTGQPNPTAQHCVGMAVANFILQAVAEGLHTHQMGGFDRDRARVAFGIPDTHEPIAVIALGYDAPTETLDDEKLRGRNDNPERTRKKLTEFVFSGATNSWGEPSLLASPVPTVPEE